MVWGTTVYSERPTKWTGKIALAYPSDYGYATAGGTTTNRASCLAKELYGKEQISERHRHRYEYNNEYKGKLEAKGLICSGTSPDGKLVEIVEIKNHPYFIATQFHPEFKSRPDKPHPLFTKLIKATLLN